MVVTGNTSVTNSMDTHMPLLLSEGVRKVEVLLCGPLVTLQQDTMIIHHRPAYSLLIPSDPPTTAPLRATQPSALSAVGSILQEYLKQFIRNLPQSTLPQPLMLTTHPHNPNPNPHT